MMRVPRLIGRIAKAPRPWIFERRSAKYLFPLAAGERVFFAAGAGRRRPVEVERVLVAMFESKVKSRPRA